MHLGTIGYPSQQIARAVTWLKRNFVQPLRVDGLADRAHMSPSTLRQHFRAITGVSPLQFQKQSRLGAARSPSNGIHEVMGSIRQLHQLQKQLSGPANPLNRGFVYFVSILAGTRWTSANPSGACAFLRSRRL